jgi:hypothetical protein
MREIFIAARAYIKRGWVQYEDAESAAGLRTLPTCHEEGRWSDVSAVRWSVNGAIEAALGSTGSASVLAEQMHAMRLGELAVAFYEANRSEIDAAMGLSPDHPHHRIRRWNDKYGMTVDQILAAFDRVIGIRLVPDQGELK